MAGTLDGKVAIVTGAGRGLGRVMTLGLLEAGARVAAVETRCAGARRNRRAPPINAAPASASTVSSPTSRGTTARRKSCAPPSERFGRLDILINNAGINTSLLRREGQPVGKFWEVTPKEFRRIIDVNVVAAFLMTRAALPVMLKQRWGRIINVTTSLDTMWRAGCSPTAARRRRTRRISRAMAQELEGTGVTANVLVPGGAADTRMVSRSTAPDRAKLIAPEVMVRAARLAVLERVRRRQRPALHRHALGQEPAAGGSREERRRAGGLATARPSGDHAG